MAEKWNDINHPGVPFFLRKKKEEQEEQERKAREEANAADVTQTKPLVPLKVDFIRWRHTDEEKFKETYDECAHGDIIELKAEAQGVDPGSMVQFEVVELPSDPGSNFSKSIWSKGGTTDPDNTAVVQWTVDLSQVTDPSKLRFAASVRSKYAEIKCPIKIVSNSKTIPMRFPLDKKYNDLGYKNGERAFGASRSHGKRAHAGCDLYAPVGEKIFAVADGIIIDYYDFYGQTYALEVNHGDFIVRYGEVQPPLTNKYAASRVLVGDPKI